MRKLVLALVCLGFVACRHPASKIEGHWQGTKVDGVLPGAQAPGDQFAQQTEIIAQGNQIAIQTPQSRNPAAAVFYVDKEDTTTLVLHTDKDNSTETFTFNEKADVMVWKVDAQRSITFRKLPDSPR